MSNYLEQIRAKRASLDFEREQQEKSIMAKNKLAIMKIKSFKEDIAELIEIANEMQYNGFLLGRMEDGEVSPRFVTNWWSHKLAFYPEEHPTTLRRNQIYSIKGIGIMNGGACGEEDFIVTLDGIENYGRALEDGTLYDAIRCANEFEKFKSEFIDYVNQVTK